MRHIPTAVTAQGAARRGQIRRAAPALKTPKGSVSVAQPGVQYFFFGAQSGRLLFFWCPQVEAIELEAPGFNSARRR